MKDAFGGAFMINIMLIFLGIFISFIAVAVSYAKAFRVKNQIINYIQQYEGLTRDAEDAIDRYLKEAAYYVNVSTGDACYATRTNSELGSGCKEVEGVNPYQLRPQEAMCTDRGYCVRSVPVNSNGNTGTYYVITTYLQIQFTLFNLSFNVPITGETRLLTTQVRPTYS